jgi:hypothetical protein
MEFPEHILESSEVVHNMWRYKHPPAVCVYSSDNAKVPMTARAD